MEAEDKLDDVLRHVPKQIGTEAHQESEAVVTVRRIRLVVIIISNGGPGDILLATFALLVVVRLVS